MSFAAVIAVAIGHTFNYRREMHVSADEVTRVEGERTRLLVAQG